MHLTEHQVGQLRAFAAMVNETDEDMQMADVHVSERTVHQVMAEGILNAWYETVAVPKDSRSYLTKQIFRWQENFQRRMMG